MIIEPTQKYTDFILQSAHYLNYPKFIFNEAINSLVRMYSKEVAIENIRSWFKRWGNSTANVNEVVEYHSNVKIADFMKLNVNSYLENTPDHVIARDNYVNAWFKAHTKEPTIWDRYPSEPSFPFKEL